MTTPNVSLRFTPHDLEALGVIQEELGLDRTAALRVLIHERRRAIEVAKAKVARFAKRQQPGA